MELATLLNHLVALKTITFDKEANKLAITWVLDQIKHLPINQTQFEVGGYSSVILTTQKTTKPKVMLYSHIDVDDGNPSLFNPRIENHKLYGRGAYDMKFALACYIKLLLELGGSLPKYDFGLMITSDEEKGGFNGAGTILKDYSTEFCLIPDGGEDWNFESISKGVYQIEIEITSHGHSAHSARPWQGENAIEKLMAFLTLLKSNFDQVSCNNDDHYYTTANISTISGGKATNTVPDIAKAMIDIRYIPEMGLSKLRKIVSDIKANFTEVDVTEVALGSSVKVDLSNALVKKFLITCSEITGNASLPIISHGASDARFFAEKSIPTILIRPKGGDLHSDNEWIDLDDLALFYNAIKTFVTETTYIND